MKPAKSDFLYTLQERGFFHQCTDWDALDNAATAGSITAYTGYDATANSLHVGNLVSIMMLRWLQKTGHKPIVLIGGGTTKIGDPSGKDETRKILSDEDIQSNISGVKKAFTKFIDFSPGQAILVNNADWLESLSYIPFLQDIGRHFTINRMLTFDNVRLRLEREQPLTFLEFNYMIMQGYDFVELKRRHNCVLQMGGSDQWGNIVNGVDLGRRMANAALFGLTTPLITTASGAKMGKTAAGAVWINPDRLSPYDYYQFWRNTEDADVGRFLRLFTELPIDEIKRLETLAGAEINEAKKILALEATKLAHGEVEAVTVAETARQTFEQGVSAAGLPTIEINAAALAQGVLLADIVVQAGLTQSKGEAKRLIKQGGVSVNDEVIKEEMHTLSASDNQNGQIKLSAGKKRHVLVKLI